MVKTSVHDRFYLYWLFVSLIFIFTTIIIGGLTRLKQSGLSMTEWQLLKILPPITTQEWIIEFNKYKTSPEFIIINNSMSLAEFKNIFWLEYIHRIIARLVGLVIILPCWYFYFKGKFKSIFQPIIYSLLVIAQGIIGWYMVKSGLKNAPHVSHYRLAIHLLGAATLYSLLIWRLFDSLKLSSSKIASLNSLKNLLIPFSGLLFWQIVLGAFVAGLKGGLVYNSFPLMNGYIIPPEISKLDFNIFNDPVGVQFLHRITSYIISLLTILISLHLVNKKQYILALILFSLVFVQMLLGVLTLLSLLSLNYAIIHQAFSILLLSIVLLFTKFSLYKLTN